MRVHSEWLGAIGAEVTPDWKAQLQQYEKARAAPKPDPLAVVFDRLRTLSRTWLSLATSPNGRDAMAAREMRPALDETIVAVARLCIRDEGLLDRIGDADARRAVEATMKKIRDKETTT
jgi:hypothetical protein